MADFAGSILSSHANYASGGVGAIDPVQFSSTPSPMTSTEGSSSGEQSNAFDWQSIQKCKADYDQIPHGWRPSAFMGKCGYKIQAKKFYSADTPCYPIQDLSCMGPVQKRVWANICATEFPCKAPEPETIKFFPAPTEPSWFSRFMSDVGNVFHSHMLVLCGVTLGSCLTVSMIGSRSSESKKVPNDED